MLNVKCLELNQFNKLFNTSFYFKVQSVHFPDTYDLEEQVIEIVQPTTLDQVVDMINSARKRDLTDWNHA